MWERILKRPFLSVWIWTLALHVMLFAFAFPKSFLESHATDGSQYIAIANNLLAGNGFSLRVEPPYIADTIRTPIYPGFLVAVMHVAGSPHASLPIVLVLGTFISLAGMVVARSLTEDRRMWVATGLILSLDPNLWYYSFILGSEGVFLPLVAAGIAGAFEAFRKKSWKLAIVAGALTGLAALARPIVQFVPILFAVTILAFWFRQPNLRKTALKMAGGFVLAYFVTVSPWLIRNYHSFGVWDYSNVGWFNFYTRVAATAESIATRRPYDPMRVEYLQRLHDKGYIQKTPVEEHDVHGYEFKSIFQKETWEAVKKYPKETILSQVSAGWTVVSQDISVLFLRDLGWIKLEYPTFAPLVLFAQDGFFVAAKAILALAATPWLIAILARFVWLGFFFAALIAIVVCWKTKRGERPQMVFAWLYMLGIVALSLNAAAQADGRYRSQFIFVEIPLALLTIDMLRRKQKIPGAIPCRACQTKSWTHRIGTRHEYGLWRCRLCGTVTVDPMPSEQVRQAFYSNEYFFGGSYSDYDADKIATRHTYEKMLDLIDTYRKPGSSLLDIGAATGMFLMWAKERGWKTLGQEISEAAVSKARERGIEMTTQKISQLSAAQFSAITMLDVIEHLDAPREAICDLKSRLEPEGILFINTPDSGSVFARLMGSKWHALCPPEHLVIFSERGLRILLEQEGYDIVWSGRIPKTFRFSYIAGTAARWLGLKQLNTLENWFRSHSRLDISIPLPLRDNIAVIARRHV